MASEHAARHVHRWVAWEDVPPVPYRGLFTCEGCALTGTRATLARLQALEEVVQLVADLEAASVVLPDFDDVMLRHETINVLYLRLKARELMRQDSQEVAG